MQPTETVIDQMVDRFLSWKLPEDFAPDCGISFDRSGHNYEPAGTNLLTAAQAKQMFLHCLPAPAQIGQQLGGGFFGGEMLINGERFALIVAPKAEGEKLELEYKLNDRSTSDETDSDDDGLINTNRINDANHPAAQFCRSLNIGGYDDWYLPSRDELAMLCRNLGPNRKTTPDLFKADAAEAFEEDWYWSSTEHAQDSNFAWIVGFLSGYQDYYDKIYSYGVRAVRRFKL